MHTRLALLGLAVASTAAIAQPTPPGPVAPPPRPPPPPPASDEVDAAPVEAVAPVPEPPPPPPVVAERAARRGKKKKPKVGKVVVSGFLTAWYKFRIEQNDDGVRDPDHFRLGKVVVRVSGRVDRRVGYTIEIDPRSPTLAGLLRDGYVSVHVIKGHEIRIGQQKTPFGFENWQSSASLYTVTRSELSEGIGRGFTHRDLGVGLVGKIKVNDRLRVEDAVALVNGAGFGVQADNTQMKNLWGRVGIRYRTGGLTIRSGVSGAVGDELGELDPGPPPVPATRFSFRRLGGDLEIDTSFLHVGIEAGVGWTTDPADTGETETDLAYTALVAGKTRWHVGPVVRYDAADADGFQRVTAGGYWGEPDARVRALLHYEWFSDDDVGTHDGRVTAAAIVRF